VKEIPTISQYRTLHESLIDASSGLLSLSSHSEWIAPKLSQFWMDYSLFLDNELSVFHTLWSSISPSVKSAIVFQDFMARMMPNGGIISLLGLIGRAFQNVAAERRIHPLLMTLLLQFPVPHYYAFIAMHFADPLCGVNDGEISKNQTRLISRLVESMEMLVEEESIAQQQIKFRDQIESEPEFRSIVCALPDSSTFAPTSSPSKATIATAFGHKENSATEAIVEMFQLFRTGDPAPLKHYFFPAGDVPVTKLLSADAMSRTFAMLVGCVRRLSWMDMCLWLSGKLSANSLEPSDSAVPLPAAKKLKTNSGASFSAEHSITAKDIFELHTLHAFLLFYR
jgi:hypothetical protein